MPGSLYLTGTDLEVFGVPNATQGMVAQASGLIDHYLQRPSGCLWTPDANGLPCYMTALAPIMTLRAQQGIAPGKAITVPIAGFQGDDSIVGEAVVLDRANAERTELCVVQSIAAGQIVLKNVQFAHDAPVTIDFGLAITEERGLPTHRSVTRLSQWPIVRVVSGVGRYGYARRSEQILGYYDDMNLLAMYGSFGGPPAWELFDMQVSSMNPRTGDIWVPSGLLAANFTNVKLRYVGGWPAAALPREIKTACAQLIRAANDAPMGAQVRRFIAGKTSIERFSDSIFDNDIKSLIREYRATVLG